VDQPSARRLVADARVAVLTTVSAEGRPHVVPCCFVIESDTIYSAVDTKPKTTLALRRIENLRSNPFASLLVHAYTEDWSELWWVRVDGTGRVVKAADERLRALRLLAAKYPQYREVQPPGDVVALTIERWRSWP
jgi:PPOX class probable F420-dependent enzyme